MADFKQRRIVNDRILELYRGDPFEEIIREAEIHRVSHGPGCGLFPAGPHVMRFASTVARGAQARRVLDLGTGFGYSAIWFASACGDGCMVDAIDLFSEHVAQGERFASQFGCSDRVKFIVGDVSKTLEKLAGPYDLIHDDAWFAAEPPYFDRLIELLRPGGTLTMPNWFLLEDAITGEARRDWAEFAGPNWASSTLAYAERLAADPRLSVAWSVSPPLAVAVSSQSRPVNKALQQTSASRELLNWGWQTRPPSNKALQRTELPRRKWTGFQAAEVIVSYSSGEW